MSGFTAACYGLAVVLLFGALTTRTDPRLRRLLGELRAPRPRNRVRGWIASCLDRASRAWARGRKGVELAAAMPDLLDVLAVSVTAGLSPRLALERAPELLPGPVGTVLTSIRREVELGTTWSRALHSAAAAFDVEEFRRLAVTLNRAERLGSPVAERLRDLAIEVRAERRARREERARRAPVQMLFPLVFLILPAFVLAAVAPALLVATRDLI